MRDDSGTPTAFDLVDGAALHRIVEEVRMAPCEGTCAGAGTCGTACAPESRNDRLSYYTKRGIEASATAAARENRTPRDECPYRDDFAPLERAHWMACFLLAGGTINPKE